MRSGKGLSAAAWTGIIIVIIVIVIAGAWAATRHPAATTTTTTVTTTATQTPTATTSPYKLAAIFPGTIQDADYNTLGYLAITHVKEVYGIPIAYSERVAVPDAERVIEEYIGLGYNIIWTHGAQFNTAALKKAQEHPDVIFIIETDGPLQNQPKNVWVMDRNFPTGFYVLGVIAGKSTKTGKIGYIGGLDLPFSKAEVNAALMGIKSVNPNAQLKFVWVGDFNDPVKTRSIAESLISEGVDFIMSSVNLGNYGLFEAVKAANTKVLVTVKYTDKSSFIPDNYVTSYIYDFGVALEHIIGKIINENATSGYYKIEFGKACYIQFPLKNVSPDVEQAAKDAVNKILSGEIVVPFNTTLPGGG
jgi:basic membrane protein A